MQKILFAVLSAAFVLGLSPHEYLAAEPVSAGNFDRSKLVGRWKHVHHHSIKTTEWGVTESEEKLPRINRDILVFNADGTGEHLIRIAAESKKYYGGKRYRAEPFTWESDGDRLKIIKPGYDPPMEEEAGITELTSKRLVVSYESSLSITVGSDEDRLNSEMTNTYRKAR